MASIRKRGKSWYAEVWANNQRTAKSFPTKKLAEDWAYQTERRTRKSGLVDRTFADLLDRYRREVTPTKDGEAWEAKRIGFFERDAFAEILVSDLTPGKVAEFRDRLLKEVSGSTINRDFNLLSNVCRYAVKEWGWMAENPFSEVKRPKPNRHRDRLVTDEEIERLIYAGRELASIGGRTVQAFRFSIETGMRAGEVLALRKTDVLRVV